MANAPTRASAVPQALRISFDFDKNILTPLGPACHYYELESGPMCRNKQKLSKSDSPSQYRSQPLPSDFLGLTVVEGPANRIVGRLARQSNLCHIAPRFYGRTG